MNLLTQQQALEKINERLPKAIPRQTFERFIRPLMTQEGDAQQMGTGKRASWVYDGDRIWRWADYLTKRAALIELKHPGWHSRRAYSIEDLDNLVHVGVWDGEIDHPAFQVANNQ